MNKEKHIRKIYNVLSKSKVSDDEYDSTQIPFYLFDKKNDFEINHELIENIPKGLNRNIKIIYDILGNPKKEIYMKEWTIFSVNKALEIYKEYCNNGQTNIFDIGFIYQGMGHIRIIACDLTTHLLFYHNGGGSNGYDCENNFHETIKNGSKNKEQYFFSEWFYNIK